MAYLELALTELESNFRTLFPTYLQTLSTERADGLVLEPFRQIEWEEIRQIDVTPALLMIGLDESDPDLRDQLFNATIMCYVILTDKAKRHLTKKLYRYAEAMRRMIRVVGARTLNQTVISAKVERVEYSPIFVDRTNLFARDFQATITLRMAREGM